MNIRIPEQKKPTKGSFDIRPKAIEKWEASLPIANLGETSRRLYKALLEINGLEIKTKDRMKTLGILSGTSAFVVEGLRKHYVGQSFPLLDKNRNIVELSQEILSEMAIGYKIVAAELLESRLRIDKKTLAQALNNAMAYMTLMLLESYEVYAPHRPNVWREIHQLFRVAEKNGVCGVVTQTHRGTATKNHTITNSYKKILLFATCGPYRLRQGEALKAWELVQHWASNAELVEPSSPDATKAHYFIRMNSDEPPIALRPDGSSETMEMSRAFITQPLSGLVTSQIKKMKESISNSATKASNIDLLKRLGIAWGHVAQRKYSRFSKISPVNATVGIDAIHHFIMNPQGGSASDTSRFETVDFVYPPPTSARIELGTQINVQKKQPSSITKPPADHHIDDWELQNFSAGGCCLLWENQHRCRVHVGELISIKDVDADEPRWRVSVVRWMKSKRGKGLEVGVQIISPQAVGARVKNLKRNNFDDSEAKCLLLPEIKALRQAPTIITPSMEFVVGSKIKIAVDDRSIELQLLKLIEHTGYFAQYEYTEINQQSTDAEAEDTMVDFNSIWASL